MNESSNKIDRLAARLHRGIEQCDRVEQRAGLIDERFGKLHESVQTLSRLFDVSFLILISSDQEKLRWLQLIDSKQVDLANPVLEQFIYRLELHLSRTISDNHEKRAYLQTLFLLQSTASISSSLFK